MDKVVWAGVRTRPARMTTCLLFVFMAIAIGFASAHATTREVPVKVRAVEVDGSAWTIEVIAGREGTLDGVRIDGVKSLSPLPASDSAPSAAGVSQRFRVTTSDGASVTHCVVRYR
ncbi:MAG TPA: hypothetical protein VF247_12105, partial [Candidatus Krumholzibacteria bacterium]